MLRIRWGVGWAPYQECPALRSSKIRHTHYLVILKITHKLSPAYNQTNLEINHHYQMRRIHPALEEARHTHPSLRKIGRHTQPALREIKHTHPSLREIGHTHPALKEINHAHKL